MSELSRETIEGWRKWLLNEYRDPEDEQDRINIIEINAIHDAALRALSQPPSSEAPCRTDGRCQYAIDHGAEGLGHCPEGKCCMPRADSEAVRLLTRAVYDLSQEVEWVVREANYPKSAWVERVNVLLADIRAHLARQPAAQSDDGLRKALENIAVLAENAYGNSTFHPRIAKMARAALRQPAAREPEGQWVPKEPKPGLLCGDVAISTDPRYAGWIFVRHVDGANWTTGAKLTDETWAMLRASSPTEGEPK